MPSCRASFHPLAHRGYKTVQMRQTRQHHKGVSCNLRHNRCCKRARTIGSAATSRRGKQQDSSTVTFVSNICCIQSALLLAGGMLHCRCTTASKFESSRLDRAVHRGEGNRILRLSQVSMKERTLQNSPRLISVSSVESQASQALHAQSHAAPTCTAGA